jgi:uncharacterized protein (DUF433 family)
MSTESATLTNPELLRAYRDGYTDAEIAERYGLDIDEVIRRRRAMGLGK